MTEQLKVKSHSFYQRVKSMVKVDFRRMFTMPLVYILIGISLVAPILILVMTSMMDGMVSVDPQTGAQTVMQGFDNVWQIIGTASTTQANATAGAGGMDMMAMCNINLMYFAMAVLVCVFVSEDFKSGYAKNLFTVRARKSDYVVSKTLVCFIGGALMILAFFIGSILGGVFSGVSFSLSEVGTSAFGLIACVISKMLLSLIFASIFLTLSVVAKQRTWLSILLCLGLGMFLFMMIPIISPLNATFMHVILCIAGGVAFGCGLGYVSNLILSKTALI